MSRPRRSTAELLAYGVGGFGSVLTTGGALTGDFIALQPLVDTDFTAVSGDVSGISELDAGAITIPAGVVLFGNFTYVEVSSGAAMAYYA
jgi:hypothetical protein